MRRWLLVQMLVLAALVTAACSTNPPTATPTPTPTLRPPAIATPTPDDVADNAYYRCGGEVGYELVELTDLIGQTPLTDSTMCPSLQGWQATLEGIREQHGNCPVPRSAHLLEARNSVDGALVKMAEALFYLSEYCGSLSGGEEYWDACLDAVLEAQFHMSESSRAFEAFIVRDTVEPEINETAHPPAASPTAVATDTPKPTVPPTAAQTTPAPSDLRYVPYVNTTLAFAAEYPAGWGVQVHDVQDPLTGEVLGKAAEFYSPYDPEGSLLQLLDITVQVIAGIKGAPARIPTDQEYKQFIREWVIEREQEVVSEPTLVSVDGYAAVQVAYMGTDAFEQYSLVGYGTMLMTEDRFVFIEGAAATENQERMRNIYEHFMSTLDLLPLP